MHSPAYKSYVLSILTLVYTLNFVDGGLVTLLLQPIKEDLHLSDSQLGLLTGIASALFYATLGLPVARWADRGNRVTITSLAIALWGVTVMSCIFVGNFVQLVFARVAATVGQAGCMPPTYSLIGDYFPDAAGRTRAMSIYMLASPLSWLLSFIAGGWLNELYGWRVAFLIMGLPGLFAAAVVRFTVVEPRIRIESFGVLESTRLGMSDALAALWNRQSSRHLSLGIILTFTMGYGLAPWYAAFMIREHGMGTGELGLWLGLVFGLGGILGIYLGGQIATHRFAGDERGHTRLCAITVAALVPWFFLFLLLPNRYGALIALIPFAVVGNMFFGPAFALLQRLTATESRAMTLALVMLLANLVGMGAGPQIVGILSDVMAPKFGVDSLRYAMLLMCTVALYASYHFWKAGGNVIQDLAACAAAIDVGVAKT